MKMVGVVTGLALFILLMNGCAKAREIELYGTPTHVEPYGLYGEIFEKSLKNTNVEYRLCVPNIILSVLFSETLVVPIVLTGWYLWEPVESIPDFDRKYKDMLEKTSNADRKDR